MLSDIFQQLHQTEVVEPWLREEVAARLEERLSFIRIEPTEILLVSFNDAAMQARFAKRYPKATITMADSGALAAGEPLAGKWRHFDLVIANLVLPWCENMAVFFKTLAVALKTDGLLMFSSLGPDTLQGLNTALGRLFRTDASPLFPDMHDVGDVMLAGPWLDPVVDRETLQARYGNLATLLEEVYAQGFGAFWPGAFEALQAAEQQTALQRFYLPDEQGHYGLSYELVYGHAWATGIQKQPGVVTVPIDSLRTTRKS